MKEEPRALPPVACTALLAELVTIINAGLDRHLDEKKSKDCRWLIELPMTDAEYYRMKEIITANPGVHPSGGASPAVGGATRCSGS